MPRYPSQGSYYSGGDRIVDLLSQRAQMAGQVQENPWAMGLPAIIGQLGQGFQGYLQNREEQKAKEQEAVLKRRQSEVFNAALQSNDPKQILFALGPDAGSKVLTALKANTPDGFKAYRDKMEAFRDTAIGVENAPEADRPKLWGFAIQNMASMGALTPEQAEQYGTYDPAVSKSVAGFGAKPGEGPKTPEQIEAEAAARARGEASATKTPAQIEAEAAARARGEASARPAPKAEKEERLVQILKNGQPTWVRESEAVGQPTGEAGKGRELKPILSGDIEDLAGMQESIDLAESLGESLKGGKAGGASRLGAALPDVITEMTGLGAESKGTQSKINVAKQIIGKGLEGGVLRKEDEAKYEKMLPKLGDSDTVVTEKLANLKKAIENKMNRRLEALEDAGRDVTAYRRRQGGTKISGGTDAEPPDA